MLRGEKVHLRPFNEEDLERFRSWNNDPDYLSEYNFFGLSAYHHRNQRFHENGLLGEKYGALVVETNQGEIAGDVSYHPNTYGPNEGSMAYNIGISLAPQHRGKGYGVEAQRLLAEYLLAIYPIARIEASTDITNIAEQRALEKAGFTREGIIRQCQWRNGARHDLVLYSKLRGE